MTNLEFLLFAVLVITAAFVSSSEVALFSLSRFQIRSFKEKSLPVYRRIKSLISDTNGLLTTVLFTNELVNISLSALFAGIVSRKWDSASDGTWIGAAAHWFQEAFPLVPAWLGQSFVSILFTTPIVVILCDLTPKVIGARINLLLAPSLSVPLSLLYRLFTPIRWFTRVSIDRLAVLISGKKKDQSEESAVLKEEEFLFLVEEGVKEGALQQGEVELIKNVLELDDTRVSEICTPIERVQTLDQDLSLKDALAQLKDLPYSRIPVTRKKSSEIVGILYTKDLLLTRLMPKEELAEMLDQTIAILMRKPMLISHSTPLNTVFRKMKKSQMHLAVISHDNGKPKGIVTMNGVLHALFEDLIGDEGDPR